MNSSTAVGTIVAVLIIGAVASVGYFQFEVAPGYASTSTSSSGPSVTCPSAECVNVTIPGGAGIPPTGYTSGSKTTFGYTPDAVTVVIGVNNTIYWTNQDAAIHTATSDPGAPAAFDSGNIAAGGTAQITLTVPGTYHYHCTYHAWMQGTIVVVAGSSSSTTST